MGLLDIFRTKPPKGLPILWKDFTSYMKEEEIKKIEDQKILSWILRNEGANIVRRAAFKKLKDQKLMKNNESDNDDARRYPFCESCGNNRKGKMGVFFYGTYNPEKSHQKYDDDGVTVTITKISIYDIIGSEEGFICNYCVLRDVLFKLLFSMILIALFVFLAVISVYGMLKEIPAWIFKEMPYVLRLLSFLYLCLFVYMIVSVIKKLFKERWLLYLISNARDNILIEIYRDEIDGNLFLTRREYYQRRKQNKKKWLS